LAASKGRTAKTVVSLIVLAIAMGFITWLVYLQGTTSIAVHFYYLPIIWAGFAFGDYGALVAWILAALACGAWMPAEPAVGPEGQPVQQELLDVLLRTLIFFVVAMFASRLSFALKRRMTEAQTLYQVAHSITSSLRIKEVLELITDHAMRVMDAKACNIRLLDEESGELELVATAGLSDDYWEKGPVVLEGNVTDKRVLRGHAEQIYDVLADPGFQYPEAGREAGLTSALIVPLETKEETLGLIRVYSRSPHKFSRREINLLTTFAHQASVAIENAELYEDIRRNYYETVRTLTRAIEARDMETYSHSERVTDLVEKIAQQVGVSDEQRELLQFGSILHDIGKIGLADTDTATSNELDQAGEVFYRMHPLIGQSILQPVTFLAPVLSVITHHHECWDGSGFPEALQGDDIPYEARIVAIADAYDRLINPHDPVVNHGLSPREALQEIVAGAGTRFDPKLVAAFRRATGQSQSEDQDSSQ